jgi:hypothetical protein
MLVGMTREGLEANGGVEQDDYYCNGTYVGWAASAGRGRVLAPRTPDAPRARE